MADNLPDGGTPKLGDRYLTKNPVFNLGRTFSLIGGGRRLECTIPTDFPFRFIRFRLDGVVEGSHDGEHFEATEHRAKQADGEGPNAPSQ